MEFIKISLKALRQTSFSQAEEASKYPNDFLHLLPAVAQLAALSLLTQRIQIVAGILTT